MPALHQRFLFVIWLFVLACTPPNKPRVDSPKEVHLLLHLLFYLEADAAKVEENERDWTQHKIIANDLVETASLLGNAEISKEVSELKTMIVEKAPTQKRQEKSQRLQSQLIEKYKPLRSPEQKPDRLRGENKFSLLCAECHGKDGKAQTRKASQLKTPPASLVDPLVTKPLSPYAVYNFLRFGLGEMPSFELSPEEDRWDLAFYVFTLQRPVQKNEDEILSLLPSSIPKSFDALSEISDADLINRLQQADVADVEAALRALRGLAPYR